MSHEVVEKNIGLLAILVILVISVGGLVEIVPLFFQTETTTPAPGVKKYSALHLEGRDVYVREGCYNCHSQMIRPFRAETERYGHYSLAGESVYDHPFQWGSKRTGPDLARVGGRYSDEWHLVHLYNPRDVVPESNMPAYPWLSEAVLTGDDTAAKMRALNIAVAATCPTCDLYTEEEMANAKDALMVTDLTVEGGKRMATEAEALVAYLQGLGLASKQW
jgi:cytochrome c oxidase cbb3-type subunit 2